MDDRVGVPMSASKHCTNVHVRVSYHRAQISPIPSPRATRSTLDPEQHRPHTEPARRWRPLTTRRSAPFIPEITAAGTTQRRRWGRVHCDRWYRSRSCTESGAQAVTEDLRALRRARCWGEGRHRRDFATGLHAGGNLQGVEAAVDIAAPSRLLLLSPLVAARAYYPAQPAHEESGGTAADDHGRNDDERNLPPLQGAAFRCTLPLT